MTFSSTGCGLSRQKYTHLNHREPCTSQYLEVFFWKFLKPYLGTLTYRTAPECPHEPLGTLTGHLRPRDNITVMGEKIHQLWRTQAHKPEEAAETRPKPQSSKHFGWLLKWGFMSHPTRPSPYHSGLFSESEQTQLDLKLCIS